MPNRLEPFLTVRIDEKLTNRMGSKSRASTVIENIFFTILDVECTMHYVNFTILLN